MKKIGKDQIANASFTEMLNKILGLINIKIKLTIRKLTSKLKKCKSNTAVKINLKRPPSTEGLTADKYKENLRTAAYHKELLSDKIKISDSEIKEDTKKASHILIKVKSKKSDKEGLDDKEGTKAEEI